MPDIHDLDYFKVDRNKLDQEAFDHPVNYYKVAHEVAEARYAAEKQKILVEIAKEDLKTVDSMLSINVRNDPNRYGLLKVTEASIEACVQSSTDHKSAFVAYSKAKSDLADAEHYCGVCEAAKDAMDAKGKIALSKGIDLQLANMRSTPNFGTGERRQAPV